MVSSTYICCNGRSKVEHGFVFNKFLYHDNLFIAHVVGRVPIHLLVMCACDAILQEKGTIMSTALLLTPFTGGLPNLQKQAVWESTMIT